MPTTAAQGDALGALVKAWAVAVPLGLVGRGLIKVRPSGTHARLFFFCVMREA